MRPHSLGSSLPQAFINFIDVADAYRLMTQTGGEITLQGRLLPLTWAKTRPVPRDLCAAIRQGATRNLYVANIPETFTEPAVLSMFGPFGELESVRLAPRKHVAFINFAAVTSAIRAKEAMHYKYPAPRDGNGLTEPAARPMLINFTSAQQNCMRARGGRPSQGIWAEQGGGGRGRGYDQRGGGGGGGGGGYGGGGDSAADR